MRAILFLLAALISGPVLILSGITDYKNSKALKAEGQAITAQVVDGEETVGRKGRRSYWLTVSYTPQQGATVTETTKVSRGVFDRAMSDKTIRLTYLPSNPEVFQLGETVKIRTGSVVFGSLILAGALGFLGYLFFQWRSSKSTAPAPMTVNAPPTGSISVNAGINASSDDQQKAA